MRYRRYFAFALLGALMALLLAGCVELDIAMSIDDSFNSVLAYKVTIDVGGADPLYHQMLADALHSLGWHYQENLGFTASVDTSAEKYTLNMRKSVENDSFNDAFASLKAMLQDESMSAFSQVDMTQMGDLRQSSFVIGGVLDAALILGTSNAGDLPPEVRQELETAFEESGGSIELTVPVSVISSNTHPVEVNARRGLATMTVPVNLSSGTDFELRGSIIYAKDGAQISSYGEAIDELTGYQTILIVVCASLLGIALIIFTRVMVRTRRHNKLYKKPGHPKRPVT